MTSPTSRPDQGLGRTLGPARGQTEFTTRGRWLGAALCLAVSAAACKAPEQHRAEADREVYDIISERRQQLSAVDPFTLDEATDTLRTRLMNGEQTLAVDLQDALIIAAENSRQYREQREALYLTALDLTLQRWNFSVTETASADASTSGSDDASDDRQAGAIWSWAKVFGSGLQVVGSLALRSVSLTNTGTTDRAWQEFTQATLSITQPLLRGSGADIVLEPLTQAERNVLYEAREFERFRRTFAFDVIQRYFGVLRQMDTVQNQEENFRGLQSLRSRNESFAEAGRLNEIQVDQARQDELQSRNRLLTERASLETDYDDFKFLLGLPIHVQLPLNPAEYLSLETWGWLTLDPPEDVVIALALDRRFDFRTAREQVEDAQRRVTIAEDALRNGLEFGVNASLQTENNAPERFSGEDVNWQVGLGFDFAIDRLPERNAYRASLVRLTQLQRDADELSDRIVADLRQQLRTLAAARETHEIQKRAVELAERRVESTNLSLEAGRTDTRDVLDSQESLVLARNALTSALTAYILSGLALYRDMELLEVTPEGISVDTAPVLASMEAPTP